MSFHLVRYNSLFRRLLRPAWRAGRRILGLEDPFANRSRKCVLPSPPYHAQYGQDQIFHSELFGDRRDGVFVDIGAHDGVSFSNTLFFERALGWRGICVEPVPEVFENLYRNRRATCVNACVALRGGQQELLRVKGYAEMLSGLVDSYDPLHLTRIRQEVEVHGGSVETIEVTTVRLDALLREHALRAVDLLCVDVEGAELQVLGSLDLARVAPSVICVENNYLDSTIWRTLGRAGYRAFARIGQDEVYVHRHFRPTPAIAVPCHE